MIVEPKCPFREDYDCNMFCPLALENRECSFKVLAEKATRLIEIASEVEEDNNTSTITGKSLKEIQEEQI